MVDTHGYVAWFVVGSPRTETLNLLTQRYVDILSDPKIFLVVKTLSFPHFRHFSCDNLSSLQRTNSNFLNVICLMMS